MSTDTYPQAAVANGQFESSAVKILVLGESGAGKSSLIVRTATGSFPAPSIRSKVVDFETKPVKVEKELFQLQLWDVPGQERLGGMNRLLCRDVAGLLLVCDATRPESIDAAAEWKERLDSWVSMGDGTSVPSVFVANKADLLRSLEERQHVERILRARARLCGLSDDADTMFVSAKTGSGVDAAVSRLVESVVKRDRMRLLKASTHDGLSEMEAEGLLNGSLPSDGPARRGSGVRLSHRCQRCCRGGEDGGCCTG
uniref:Uncharacterized protein n=1 Tax=Chromera velia CCMP2878 TaxID=1169474 RepID=A0A0G4FL08_9ALVE|mmetsp:Transcript_29928/g.58727  ORF Transcript_29928/g.58727 Transcript_29928/m.58727 type:complete len:256 (-) Transcript_29928:208-975(-)|eukprot:Cvel_17533.t1-p1 / transcript=Cvel_17533.t1 / gene=Cvel_17533 / organism=Chromera_velia_CCMP2878 / gene_product=Ras-related protein Rab-7L1, putative / transcript_product=Ras-related protein Rab-7L1, putative / location=Cvel_scaffold1406:15764-19704(-) / protein_length=255 / sequence_SO=supercontig / SO=protein_coding / is_pseudo=false